MKTMLYLPVAWFNDHCEREDRMTVRLRSSGNFQLNVTVACGDLNK